VEVRIDSASHFQCCTSGKREVGNHLTDIHENDRILVFPKAKAVPLHAKKALGGEEV
jgi:hypothetical protein